MQNTPQGRRFASTYLIAVHNKSSFRWKCSNQEDRIYRPTQLSILIIRVTQNRVLLFYAMHRKCAHHYKPTQCYQVIGVLLEMQSLNYTHGHRISLGFFKLFSFSCRIVLAFRTLYSTPSPMSTRLRGIIRLGLNIYN